VYTVHTGWTERLFLSKRVRCRKEREGGFFHFLLNGPFLTRLSGRRLICMIRKNEACPRWHVGCWSWNNIFRRICCSVLVRIGEAGASIEQDSDSCREVYLMLLCVCWVSVVPGSGRVSPNGDICAWFFCAVSQITSPRDNQSECDLQVKGVSSCFFCLAIGVVQSACSVCIYTSRPCVTWLSM
jgi:hypothetical protein